MVFDADKGRKVEGKSYYVPAGLRTALRWILGGGLLIALTWGGMWFYFTHPIRHLTVPRWAFWGGIIAVLLALSWWRGPWLYRKSRILSPGARRMLGFLLIAVVVLFGGYWLFSRHLVQDAYHEAHAGIDQMFAPRHGSAAQAPHTRPGPATRDLVPAPAHAAPAAPQGVIPTAPPAASAARALSPFKGFWYEDRLTPERLSQIVAGALARDSSGMKRIDDAKCGRDGSCASPHDYLVAFQHYDPAAGLKEVSQLPGYIKSLEMDCTIKGRFMMADIYLPSLAASGRVDTARMSRFIGDAECVFKNPKTGRPVIAQKCANPVGKLVAPAPRPVALAAPVSDCYTITFRHPFGEGGVSHGLGGPQPLPPDRCNGYRQGKGTWQQWQTPCDQCVPDLGRGYYVYAYRYQVREESQTLSYSEEATHRVIYICLSGPNGERSRGVYVRPEDWKGRHHIDIPASLWVNDN